MSGIGNQRNETESKLAALIKAVEDHDKSEVERLIDEGVDVNEADGHGNTALLRAVQINADIEIIKALVERGKAKVEAKDRCDRSSLFYAVTKSKETASYIFKRAKYFNDSEFSRILSFFIESRCLKSHDSHPKIEEVLSLLKGKGLTSEVYAKLIVNILLCKIPLLLTSGFDGHQPSTPEHPMFHLHGKRKCFFDILKEVIECDFLDDCQKESLKNALKMIEDQRSISDILKLLKKHAPDPNFADSYGNTAFHYAACLPWMGVPEESVIEMCGMLKEFNVPLNRPNLQYETPLLFCLSGSIAHLKEEQKSTAMRSLVKVCKFLATNGSRLIERSKNGESVFHLVMKLFQQGLEIPDQRVRSEVIDETMKLLNLFSPPKVGNVVWDSEVNLHNSPLHLWASLVLTTVPPQDYTRKVSRELTFEKLLEAILDHLLKCGARARARARAKARALTNRRNRDEETPLHLCNTWIAVNLLIRNGANTDDKDSSKRPPLLVAASRKTFRTNTSEEKHRFYPDVQEEAETFFKTAIEKKLDPWAVHKRDESVLGYLVEFESYDLSNALVEVACSLKVKAKSKEIFVSLLKAICKDESLCTLWKVELVEKILSCAKKRKIDVAKEPFDVCCETMSQLRGATADMPHFPNQETAVEAESDGMGDNDPPTAPTNETNRESKNLEIQGTLHCVIAKLLREHGAELSGKSYEKLKTKCKEMDKILENTQVQVLLRRTSVSRKHKKVLDKVARYQECMEIGESVCCHKDPAVGSFGADVFVGINRLNRKEVAIRRMEETECNQELGTLYAHLECEHVIRYLLHLEPDNDPALYIVFELMEGNLDDYFSDAAAFDSNNGTSLCRDIVQGLNYLHKNDICHFQEHLKPTSIFYKTHPKLCLKITDFGQPGTPSDVIWLSPEVLTNSEEHSDSSDLFSCGMLLHYILSKGKHPFSPADCANKSKSDIVSETKTNVIDNNMEIQDSLLPEAIDLSVRMLENDSSRRPTTGEVLDHPLFWNKTKKVDFLTAVGNQPEFEYSRDGAPVVLSLIEIDFEAQFGTIVKYPKWNDPGYAHMPNIYSKMRQKRRINTIQKAAAGRLCVLGIFSKSCDGSVQGCNHSWMGSDERRDQVRHEKVKIRVTTVRVTFILYSPSVQNMVNGLYQLYSTEKSRTIAHFRYIKILSQYRGPGE